MRILAVDPGLTYPAACWASEGRIVLARRVPVPDEWSKLDLLDRCDRIALEIDTWACNTCCALPPHLIVVEWPQWYSGAKSPGDPNDLAALCGIAGSLVGRLRSSSERGETANYCPPRIEVRAPKPREVWGNLPKATRGDPWKSPRAARLASRLTPAERAVVQDKHDAMDAAGLALWAMGRWERVRGERGAV